ncbi:hypothetical protein HAX54_009025 [Datura stramonium]|uniref:Uncharacterized protein n=1 Tax=Datura stramonium TaxID=4076 RepID=A0ABS8TFY4_DATST|nr:hypothetical protein [Datura stramonium]
MPHHHDAKPLSLSSHKFPLSSKDDHLRSTWVICWRVVACLRLLPSNIGQPFSLNNLMPQYPSLPQGFHRGIVTLVGRRENSLITHPNDDYDRRWIDRFVVVSIEDLIDHLLPKS